MPRLGIEPGPVGVVAALSATRPRLHKFEKEGKEEACARRRVAAAPIAVSAGRSAPHARYTCLYACTRTPVAFRQNHIPTPALAANAVVCSTALTTHIFAMRWARHVERVILAEGIQTYI